jgi:hypothetical protein
VLNWNPSGTPTKIYPQPKSSKLLKILVVETVWSEPVSNTFTLITGKEQGKSCFFNRKTQKATEILA